MVQLFIKEQNTSNVARLVVKNENRRDVFLIDGRWGNKGDCIKLYTLNGTCLVEVTQQTLSVYPKFKLKIHDVPMGYIKKKPRLLQSPIYEVKRFGWRVSGNYKKREYTVKRKRDLIMTVDKAVTSFGDFYSLDIKEPSHAPLCCVLAVIIDHYSINKEHHKRRKAEHQQILQRQN